MTNRIRRALTVLATSLLLTTTACAVPGKPTAQSYTDHDLGNGLVWTGPVDATVQALTDGADGCPEADATVAISADDDVYLTLIASTCPQTTEPPYNGDHGTYLVPPSWAQHVSPGERVPAGTLVTFDQPYTEYTNGRNDYTDTIGLITLSGGGKKVLMLQTSGDQGATDTAAIIGIACAIRPATAPAATPAGGAACPATG